jgi:hypothetical protein
MSTGNPASDSYVQVGPDSSGKQIDNTQVQTAANPSTGNPVYRQTVSIGSGAVADRAPVDAAVGLAVLSACERQMLLVHQQLLLATVAGPAGFVPYETPVIGA